MLDFPILSPEPEPPAPRLTLDEYIEFCQFCLDQHPSEATANRREQLIREKDTKKPFRLLADYPLRVP